MPAITFILTKTKTPTVVKSFVVESLTKRRRFWILHVEFIFMSSSRGMIEAIANNGLSRVVVDPV